MRKLLLIVACCLMSGLIACSDGSENAGQAETDVKSQDAAAAKPASKPATPLAKEKLVYLYCTQAKKEYSVSPEEYRKLRNGYVDPITKENKLVPRGTAMHLSEVRYMSPYSKAFTGRAMQTCRKCKKRYIPENWVNPPAGTVRRPGPPKPNEEVCTHCGADGYDFWVEGIIKHLNEKKGRSDWRKGYLVYYCLDAKRKFIVFPKQLSKIEKGYIDSKTGKVKPMDGYGELIDHNAFIRVKSPFNGKLTGIMMSQCPKCKTRHVPEKYLDRKLDIFDGAKRVKPGVLVCPHCKTDAVEYGKADKATSNPAGN